MWSATKMSTASGIGVFAVGLDGGQLFVIRSTSEQGLDSADKENLKRRHQRRRAGAIKDFRQVGLGEIKIKQAEIAQISGHQVFEDGFAAALAEENFIAHKHIRGPELAGFDLGDEAIGLGERPHQKASIQKPSRTLLTRVRANSRDSRSSAGESSSKKLESSRET